MLKEIILKTIFVNDTKKDGTKMIDKNGLPFKMVNITDEQGNKASMFCGKFQEKLLPTIMGWKPGDKLKLNLEQSGQYVNFSIPTKTDEIEERVARLEKAVFSVGTSSTAVNEQPPIDPESIPF